MARSPLLPNNHWIETTMQLRFLLLLISSIVLVHATTEKEMLLRAKLEGKIIIFFSDPQ